MKYHTFPNTDLSVSQLCFGCWGVVTDFHWGDRAEEDSLQAMRAAIEAGVNFFDTAPMYGDGASEVLLGKFAQEHNLRDKMVIASKIRPDSMQPAEVVSGCEATLQRLQTDYLDLYQTHWTNREVPLAETWAAMQSLQQQGKVRHIGVCNAGVEDMNAILPLQKPLTNQLPFNLLWRMIEATILPRCREEQIGVLVYSPLMHGILADNYKTAADVPDGRARSRHFTTERPLARHGEAGCEQTTFAAVDKIREIAQSIHRPMADVALAWTAQQAGVVSVIAGARNADQLHKNLSFMENPLSADNLAQLSEATEQLKQELGDNPDMWDGGENSRYL